MGRPAIAPEASRTAWVRRRDGTVRCEHSSSCDHHDIVKSVATHVTKVDESGDLGQEKLLIRHVPESAFDALPVDMDSVRPKDEEIEFPFRLGVDPPRPPVDGPRIGRQGDCDDLGGCGADSGNEIQRESQEEGKRETCFSNSILTLKLGARFECSACDREEVDGCD